jgi:hypothetical protein
MPAMDDLMDLLVQDDPSSAQISDQIKDILFAKSAEKIEAIRPEVAASVFDDGAEDVDLDDSEEPVEFETDVDLDAETEEE